MEKSAMRMLFCMILYLFSGLVYIAGNAKEVSDSDRLCATSFLSNASLPVVQSEYEIGSINMIHIGVLGLFIPIHFGAREMLKFCCYTFRDVLDDNRKTGGKVSVGMSVNSSTVAADSTDEK